MSVELRRLQLAVVIPPEYATNPRVQECVQEIARCVQTAFTGTLTFDLKDGVPMSVKVTKCRRLHGVETG